MRDSFVFGEKRAQWVVQNTPTRSLLTRYPFYCRTSALGSFLTLEELLGEGRNGGSG